MVVSGSMSEDVIHAVVTGVLLTSFTLNQNADFVAHGALLVITRKHLMKALYCQMVPLLL